MTTKPNLPPRNCWLDDEPELCPSPCVFDDPSEVISDCVYAQKIKCKTDCRHYRITDGLSEAFTIVQERLDELAGDQELTIYRWPDGKWTIEHTNPSSHVQLGEVSGEYTSNGLTLERAVCNLAAQLPTSQTEAP